MKQRKIAKPAKIVPKKSPQEILGDAAEAAAARIYRRIYSDVHHPLENRVHRLYDLTASDDEENAEKIYVQVKADGGSDHPKIYEADFTKFEWYLERTQHWGSKHWLLAIVHVFHRQMYVFRRKEVEKHFDNGESYKQNWFAIPFVHASWRYDLTTEEADTLQRLAHEVRFPGQGQLF